MQLEFSDNFSSGTLGSSWTVFDNTGTPGASASIVSQQLQLQGAGTDVWESGTSFSDNYIACYLTQAVRGDFDATVYVASQSYIGEDWSKAGIMVRNNMQQPGTSAGYCIASITPGNGYTFQWDSDNDGYLDSNSQSESVIPSYIKMSRRGYSFIGYGSEDGLTWAEIFSADLPQANSAVHIGLFNTSHRTGTANTTIFDNFKLYTGKGRFFDLF